MPESKHTPEPWKVENHHLIAPPMLAVATEVTIICVLYDEVHGTYENDEANARLIAEAPRMYELLRLTVELIDEQDEPGDIPPVLGQNIRDCLERAEGGA